MPDYCAIKSLHSVIHFVVFCLKRKPTCLLRLIQLTVYSSASLICYLHKQVSMVSSDWTDSVTGLCEGLIISLCLFEAINTTLSSICLYMVENNSFRLFNCRWHWCSRVLCCNLCIVLSPLSNNFLELILDWHAGLSKMQITNSMLWPIFNKWHFWFDFCFYLCICLYLCFHVNCGLHLSLYFSMSLRRDLGGHCFCCHTNVWYDNLGKVWFGFWSHSCLNICHRFWLFDLRFCLRKFCTVAWSSFWFGLCFGLSHVWLLLRNLGLIYRHIEYFYLRFCLWKFSTISWSPLRLGLWLSLS